MLYTNDIAERKTKNMNDIARILAEIALDIKAIKLSPAKPFVWASGYQMPIYNDNRLFLGNHRHRALIADGFLQLINENNLSPEVIAGTVTAGISPATTLADRLERPLIYVREKAKGHGLKNRIEGILAQGQKVLMIEDLVSTGGSSISAIEGVREAGGQVDVCCSIFSYGLDEANRQFEEIRCKLLPVLTYQKLLEVAIERKYISADEETLLREWRKNPFEWGDKHGFPKVQKG